MGRRRHSSENESAPTDPAGQRFEFVADDRGGVTVMRDGHPQSHVALTDPRLLEFEYVQHFALVLDALSPTAPAPLGVTHVGGAGLTLARYLDAVRPGSPQIVLEPDTALTEAVRRELPLPRGHRIRVRGVDGASGVTALKDGSADVVVLDAFADGRVPAELVTPTFVREVVRVLKPGGVLLANLADDPGLGWVARVLSTVAPHLPDLTVLATQDVLKARRFGNVVLAATADPDVLDLAAIRRGAAKAPLPTGVRFGADLTALQRGALPFTDADAVASPPPPNPGAWRVR